MVCVYNLSMFFLYKCRNLTQKRLCYNYIWISINLFLLFYKNTNKPTLTKEFSVCFCYRMLNVYPCLFAQVVVRGAMVSTVEVARNDVISFRQETRVFMSCWFIRATVPPVLVNVLSKISTQNERMKCL